MRIAQFQQHIRDRYFATDNARGVGGTFLWFAEEFGELAEALGNHAKGKGDPKALSEEFADCMAWMCTLANITGIDLEKAIHDKYLADGGPKGTK
ncbi:MAG: nucleotide pyrophosphohydrolase [Planctomycetota bacterium]|nr:nucleotide pyrophosphohydrolase [Planctomycetota bacterium]MDA1105062.1 nucleotide pyrophosphohydrolase [Planctomycetota bacterium]